VLLINLFNKSQRGHPLLRVAPSFFDYSWAGLCPLVGVIKPFSERSWTPLRLTLHLPVGFLFLVFEITFFPPFLLTCTRLAEGEPFVKTPRGCASSSPGVRFLEYKDSLVCSTLKPAQSGSINSPPSSSLSNKKRVSWNFFSIILKTCLDLVSSFYRKSLKFQRNLKLLKRRSSWDFEFLFASLFFYDPKASSVFDPI